MLFANGVVVEGINQFVYVYMLFTGSAYYGAYQGQTDESHADC